ncbi:mannose-1-phosphate guanylyltransferase/mannose-6-phosphate isomerase [Testudinibacter sp. TR-2022]|uniref:mannose-1-phosphate guanylyltransferase/mannose-6-phosphate isomerase n=1 Tax=Testudinibacter sp. TR-2022 TaxID=2585029 RepID=UPI001119ED3B|nr:mannose-1-phosphate guanylyltransferase/mannose-6-phosphate isomerase [Testudinibacter sp. TR-2022]TNH06228.1 mannose-1-phosphate guanylyltransferase/mannose-6-phosphate isomerase [Pasteurellaceae bacterium Phil11]TNH25392.1 mannose-1-phosphate guanylyltransferase/mannose-6-phosphate isomerase [Testudinibacter sp. TR-2022]TNH27533.1 mannose-1-phosphate guanylyltransferase/mannose-6-phosphate isomerase [Testudinibacter sp. TR-2022]
MFIPVIMAGGSGSRLWPLSRSMFPKQFLALDNNNDLTMLQTTLERIEGMQALEPIIITGEQHRFIVAEQMREYGSKSRIILEPAGRNTAPAIALAAFEAIKHGEDPILLVLAADHVVTNKNAFQDSIKKALVQAQDNNLVTFGIVPTAPETGYGYIQRGEVLSDAYAVKCFVEKPNLDTAQGYISSGEYYWNSGCFMFKASVYLNELKQFAPEIYNTCKKAIENGESNHDFIRAEIDEFLKCPDDSVDYAVMEKTAKAVVVPMDAGWSDVGSWSALWEVSEKDENQNVHRGDAIMESTTGCYIYAPNKLVAAVGLTDIIVVDTKDAVLVADKSKVQEVKQIVEQLKRENRKEYQEHREVYRPWGRSDAIDKGNRYKVNRITVKPGESQLMQVHYHRAEHWIVVSGTAKVTKGHEVSLITENQSIYIPVGIEHKIENPGKIPLELIEVQSGSYLSEDDILRLEY